MKLAHFYDSVRELESVDPGVDASAATARRIELASDVVRHLRDDFDHLYVYQQKYNPQLEDEKEDALALEVLRSIWQMFGAWADEAEPVYEAVNCLPAARHLVPGLDELRNNIGMARARLSVKPESIIQGASNCVAGRAFGRRCRSCGMSYALDVTPSAMSAFRALDWDAQEAILDLLDQLAREDGQLPPGGQEHYVFVRTPLVLHDRHVVADREPPPQGVAARGPCRRNVALSSACHPRPDHSYRNR